MRFFAVNIRIDSEGLVKVNGVAVSELGTKIKREYVVVYMYYSNFGKQMLHSP